MAADRPVGGGPARRRGLSRGGKIAVGLLLTLVGLFVLGGTVPTDPSTLERAVLITGIGALAVWFGGILLGSGGRTPAVGPEGTAATSRPAPPSGPGPS